jgi:hypothetical protein
VILDAGKGWRWIENMLEKYFKLIDEKFGQLGRNKR